MATKQKVTTVIVPFKNTTVGKTVRTFLQSATAVLATALPTLALNDDFRHLVANSSWAPVVLGLLPLVTALVTFLQNYLEPTTPNTVTSVSPVETNK